MTHPCDKCEMTFKTKQLLEQHVIVHIPLSERERHVCHICDQIYLSKTGLRYHYVKIHGVPLPREYKHECLICGEKFIHKNDYFVHLESHVSPEQRILFNCDKCDKTFVRKSHLNLHYQTHGKRYKCYKCNKSFATKNNITVHRRIFHD